uniref:Phosphodiesterase n=1 Tax=Trypanosoma congolense (strain IL3000) TaxID=1068625 RepID=G0UY64_TRYCI|nr:putative 3', 5'-cyclic nucleotide phosphodiesterase [Trypanosoma congolense IL3000]
MLHALCQCPAMFAITPDGCAVMARMNETAEKLSLFVATTQGDYYQSGFGEKELISVKRQLENSVDWVDFFDLIRSAFNNGCVSILARSDDAVHLLCCGEESSKGRSSLCFAIQMTEVDTVEVILEGLVSTNFFYSNVREGKNKFQKTADELDQALAQIEMLEEEACVLRDGCSWRKKQDARNTLKIEKLNDSIACLEHKNVAKLEGGGSVKPNPRENLFSLVKSLNLIDSESFRLSFEENQCETYDLPLLRLIKSRWWGDHHTGGDEVFNNVVVPYTESELKEHVDCLEGRQKGVWEALDKIDEWDFNIFELNEVMKRSDCNSHGSQTSPGALFVTMYALLVKYGFFQKFLINERIALMWLSAVEGGYQDNPYHNSMHAADVVHITHYLLKKGGLVEICELSDIQVFAALFAAAIHDYNHPGVNNNFNVLTQTFNATLYNDRSVLENMHVASVFELMREPKFNILSCLSEEQRGDFRGTVIDMVLATDMSQHERYMTQFKRCMMEKKPFTERCNQNLALSMALKLADISNCCRPLHLYLMWSTKVCEEFYVQGDLERSLGMSCSPFMDSRNPTLAQGQVSFINYIFLPFLEIMIEFLPKIRFTVELMESCREYRMEDP